MPLNYEKEKTIEYGTPDPDQNDHVREYGKDYFSRLESVGFQLVPQWESVMAARRGL